MKDDSQTGQSSRKRDFFDFFIKNVIGAIPILRAATQSSALKALDTAGMDLSMIGGSFLAMWFNIFRIPMDETVENKQGEMLGEMVVGMSSGMVAYMVATRGTRTLFKLAKSSINKCTEREEKQSLLPTHENTL